MPCYCSDTGFCNYLGIRTSTSVWNACQRWPDSQRDKIANDLSKNKSNRERLQKDKIKFCLHSVDYSRAAFEIDGIFSKLEQTKYPTDESYVQSIINSEPIFSNIKDQKCRAIITSRSEKFLSETKDWLLKYNIEYEDLFMFPDSLWFKKLSNAPRRDVPKFSKEMIIYKADIYENLKDCDIFVESNNAQAHGIFEQTTKKTISYNKGIVYEKEKTF
jgi:hypothetical protein